MCKNTEQLHLKEKMSNQSLAIIQEPFCCAPLLNLILFEESEVNLFWSIPPEYK